MPIRWDISHDKRMVVATAEGLVTLDEVEAYLDAVVIAGAMPYRKLFDASGMNARASDEDVMMLGARMNAYVATLQGGALAFVLQSRPARAFIRRYLNLNDATRPCAIFRTADAAWRWLDAQQPRAFGPGIRAGHLAAGG